MLPSEAQWEYAARSADSREYPWGGDLPMDALADFGQNSGEGPQPVGTRAAGAGPFGHLDLAGSVWEWCRDAWERDYSRWAESEPVDPVGETDPTLRPLRGGSWWNDASFLRSAIRDWYEPAVRSDGFGFRVCCIPTAVDPRVAGG